MKKRSAVVDGAFCFNIYLFQQVPAMEQFNRLGACIDNNWERPYCQQFKKKNLEPTEH